MRILFVSKLSSGKSLGPSWSVPARIKHQETIDDVLWVNCSDAFLDHWSDAKCFHKLTEYGGRLTLSVLPKDFQNPDVVVFEDFYYWPFWLFHRELLKNKIPYIIVPRGSLTLMAQNNSKKLKKKIANYLLFSSFIKKALCVHYLTNEEYQSSTDKWNNRHIIIPNGFSLPVVRKLDFSEDGINAIFIGRLNAYHKGLDLLIDACQKVKHELLGKRFNIILYGEKNRDYELLRTLVEENGLTDIISFGGEVFGKDKEKALMNADLFVMTSRFEGLPMGLLEALAYGVPALVSPGTNMADAVEKANAGWVTKTDVNAISQSLLTVIAEQNELANRGANARELAQNYEWDKLAKDFHEQVENLIKRA